jgi:hypothetical protein
VIGQDVRYLCGHDTVFPTLEAEPTYVTSTGDYVTRRITDAG